MSKIYFYVFWVVFLSFNAGYCAAAHPEDEDGDPVAQVTQIVPVAFHDSLLGRDRLPPELLRHIVSFLVPKNARNLRVVCKTLYQFIPNTWLHALSSKKMGSDGIPILVHALQVGSFMSNLRVLDLRSIGKDNVFRILRAFCGYNLPRLEELNLSGNEIGDVGVGVLVGAIERFSFPNLKVLGLSDNEIGDVGVFSILRAIDILPMFRCFYLSDNVYITTAGCLAVLEKASACPWLSLFLRGHRGQVGYAEAAHKLFIRSLRNCIIPVIRAKEGAAAAPHDDEEEWK